ncbi:MAG: hypothetical protein N2037_04645 [Acidimicrobiales bacterium]|nr:hypothetical protein [Acidimicrobiales bacterium]
MSLRAVRVSVITISVAGIAGMIVGSLQDNNGITISFGLVTAVAVVYLILLTSVVGSGPPSVTGTSSDGADSEQLAQDIERRIQALADAGCDELELRRLVTQAVELGRTRG